MSELYEEMSSNEEEYTLCKNMDCERFPPDWDEKEDTIDNYQEGQWGQWGQWKKCSICVGYYNDDGLCDILFIEEEPNNYIHSCDLCGKTKNIVQMKDTGQYICGNACDESESDYYDSDCDCDSNRSKM